MLTDVSERKKPVQFEVFDAAWVVAHMTSIINQHIIKGLEYIIF